MLFGVGLAMASPPLTYPNSAPAGIKKQAPRIDVLALIKGLKLKRGPRNTLAAWYEAARCPSQFQPFGTEILLFCANKGMEQNALMSERGARYHRRYLEKVGVVDMIFGPNSRIRPGYHRDTATHRLNVERIMQLQGQNYEQWKASRPLAKRLRPIEIRKPAAAERSTDRRPAPPPPAKTGRAREEKSLTPRQIDRLRKTLVVLCAKPEERRPKPQEISVMLCAGATSIENIPQGKPLAFALRKIADDVVTGRASRLDIESRLGKLEALIIPVLLKKLDSDRRANLEASAERMAARDGGGEARKARYLSIFASTELGFPVLNLSALEATMIKPERLDLAAALPIACKQLVIPIDQAVRALIAAGFEPREFINFVDPQTMEPKGTA